MLQSLHKTQDSVCVYLLHLTKNSSYTVKFWLFLMILKNLRQQDSLSYQDHVFCFFSFHCNIIIIIFFFFFFLASGNMNCDLSCCWKTHAETLFCFFFFSPCTIPAIQILRFSCSKQHRKQDSLMEKKKKCLLGIVTLVMLGGHS